MYVVVLLVAGEVLDVGDRGVLSACLAGLRG